jgi:hypothetical protein
VKKQLVSKRKRKKRVREKESEIILGYYTQVTYYP